MRLHYRSAVFQRLFWCALLSVLIALALAAAWPRSTMLLVLAGWVIAFALALAFSHGVDRRIARMREFTEALLETEDEPAGARALDQLGALDHSLLRMARQTGALMERGKAEAARQEAILASMVEGVLAVDERLRITGIEPGRYDAKVSYGSSRHCLVRNIEIRADAVFAISDKDLTDCSK